MRTINHDAQAVQIEIDSEKCFCRIRCNAPGRHRRAAPCRAARKASTLWERSIPPLSHARSASGQLGARRGKELDTVVFIWIMRSGNDDTCLQPQCASEVCHRGRGSRPRQQTSTPAAESPACKADSSIYPEIRVSLPISTAGRSPLVRCQSAEARTFPAE